MSVDISRALDEYKVLSDHLTELYEFQAQQKAAELATYSDVWQGAVSYGITERNALAKHASTTFTVELVKLEGDIQGTLAQLRYLDRLLEYGKDT